MDSIFPEHGRQQAAVLHRGRESERHGHDERLLAVRLGGGRVPAGSAVQRAQLHPAVERAVSGVRAGKS